MSLFLSTQHSHPAFLFFLLFAVHFGHCAGECQTLDAHRTLRRLQVARREAGKLGKWAGGQVGKPSALKIYGSCRGALFVVGARQEQQQEQLEIALDIKYNQFDCLLYFCMLGI